MKEYYLNQVCTYETQLKFAKVGYEKSVKELAEKIANATSIEESDKYIAELKAGREAIAELEKSLKYAQENYEKEAKKGDENN